MRISDWSSDVCSSDLHEDEVKRGTIGSLARRLFRREPTHPSMFGVMISSLGIVQDRISRSRLAGEPPDVHITPRLGTIGLFDFDRADEITAEGDAAGGRGRPALTDRLSIFAREHCTGPGPAF